jgi:hypothetical protein
MHFRKPRRCMSPGSSLESLLIGELPADPGAAIRPRLKGLPVPCRRYSR